VENPKAFAKKIYFATFTEVHGRIIEIEIRPGAL